MSASTHLPNLPSFLSSFISKMYRKENKGQENVQAPILERIKQHIIICKNKAPCRIEEWESHPLKKQGKETEISTDWKISNHTEMIKLPPSSGLAWECLLRDEIYSEIEDKKLNKYYISVDRVIIFSFGTKNYNSNNHFFQLAFSNSPYC